MFVQHELTLPSFPKGLHLITDLVTQAMPELKRAKVGILHVFIQHTSAGLCINENADPTVRTDMQNFIERLVPENQTYFRHTMEGPDDMPAHIKSVLFGSNLTISISEGHLNLGIWQGIYLAEFRRNGGRRRLVLTLQYD